MKTATKLKLMGTLNLVMFVSEVILYLVVFVHQYYYGAHHGNDSDISNVEHEAFDKGWGAVTSNIDWCEENYLHSFYIVELWNSLTSLVFCVIGVLTVLRYQHERDNPARFVVAYVVLVFIGLGSFAFHATLKAETQSWDELPMVYLLLIFSFEVLTLRIIPTTQSNTKAIAGGPIEALQRVDDATANRYAVGIATYALVMTVGMKVFHEQAFVFQLPFFAMAIFLLVHLFKLVHVPVYTQHMTDEGFILLQASLFSFFCGTFCWPMERLFCSYVQGYQLHAWWHIFAAIGVHGFIQCLAVVHIHVRGGDPKLVAAYYCIPVTVDNTKEA